MVLGKTKYTLLLLALVAHTPRAVAGSYVPSIDQCPVLPPRAAKPQSIDDLRADDIKVIMALGDSVMAAVTVSFAAAMVGGFRSESRGVSFGIGGDAGAGTMANFIKHYSPDLVGSSLGYRKFTLCMHNTTFCLPKEDLYYPEKDVFNAAVSGAASTTLDLELDYLFEQIARDPKVNVAEDWKMMTIFIGGNEVCRTACREANDFGIAHTPSTYEENMIKALERIRSHLPKTLVNIVLMSDLAEIKYFSDRAECEHHRRFFPGLCPCAVSYGEEGILSLRRAKLEYNARTTSLASQINENIRLEAERTGKPVDFGVTISPTFEDIKHDISPRLMSEFDCFHLSVEGHRSLAMSIWRDLHLPYSSRATNLYEQGAIFCPSETDRLRID